MESGFGEVNAVEGQFDIPVAGVNKGDVGGPKYNSILIDSIEGAALRMI